MRVGKNRGRAEIEIGPERLGTVGMTGTEIAGDVVGVVAVELVYPADAAVLRVDAEDGVAGRCRGLAVVLSGAEEERAGRHVVGRRSPHWCAGRCPLFDEK